MAPIVGVPKREPCKHCGLPVFFAERLAVDGSFYHRKCLRCARCDSQLTPGSFYETEVDGVFCCETCPDEEKKLRLGTNNNNNNDTNDADHGDGDDDSSGNHNSKNNIKTTPNGTVEQQHLSSPFNSSSSSSSITATSPEQRQSFSEKLAMFQTNGTGLLQKSLSDEEKSKSLKRLTEFYAKNAQPTIIDEIVEKSKSTAYDRIDAAATSSESSDDEDDDRNETDEMPPALPNTAPPPPFAPPHNEAITEAKTGLPQVIKPELPPIPSKANVLSKIYGKINASGGGGGNDELSIKLAIATRPRSIAQTRTEPSIAVNDKQLPFEQLQKRRDSHHNDVHESSNSLCTPTKQTQSQTNKNGATAAAVTATMANDTDNSSNDNENKDDMSTIENNLNSNTKENRLPLDALNSLTNVTKENTATVTAAEQIGASQEHAVNVHRSDAVAVINDDNNDSTTIIDDIKCDDMKTHMDNNTNIDSHNIECRTSADRKNAHNQCESLDLQSVLRTDDEQRRQQKNLIDVLRASDTNREIDGNNVNNDTDTKSHNIDKCVDDTNEMDEITMRREQQQQHQQQQHKKTSSIRDNDRQNVVRSRLSQFEALLQSTTLSPLHSPRLLRRNDVVDHGTSKQREKSIDAGVVVTDELAAQNNSTTVNEAPAELTKTEHELNAMDTIHPEMTINQLSLNDIINDVKVAPNSCTDDSLDEKNKPIPRQRATVNSVDLEDNDNDTNPPTPCKRKQKTPLSNDLKSHQAATLNDVSWKGNESASRLSPEISTRTSAANECRQNDIKYPNDLNPFGSGDEQEEEEEGESTEVVTIAKPLNSSNPFDSSDDEIELLKGTPRKATTATKNFRISTNPFGSDSENEPDSTDTDSLSAKRTPVPTPRKQINGSMLQSTPDISARHTLHPKMRLHTDNGGLHGSDASLASPSKYSNHRPISASTLNRSSQYHGSLSSLTSSTSTTPRRKKSRAPDIPTPNNAAGKSMTMTMSANSSPSHSIRATPTIMRKKRQAPLPPSLSSSPANQPNLKRESPALFSTTNRTGDFLKPRDTSLSSRHTVSSESVIDLENSLNLGASTESNYVSSSNDLSLSSTEPLSFLVGAQQSAMITADVVSTSIGDIDPSNRNELKCTEPHSVQRKLIHVDQSLLDDLMRKSIDEMPADEKIVYRRKIIPDQIGSSSSSSRPPSPASSSLQKSPVASATTDRQCEKMKENKESQNKNRQSQNGPIITASTINAAAAVVDELNQVFSPNKSSFGKWKRRKGAAPSLPVPPRKVIQMLPLQEIRHELEVIEVQQQGLEKQGVMLEKMIRERCEGADENQPLTECKPNSKEVEDLILQLFELVNEKNELFRRQAELMYLRRQHRLEQEQADIEYEIRVLMAQPECNKTDSDKAREEALISRLVEVVQLRNEVIESLEMDRRREAEEDQSIKERLELHTAKRDEELCQQQTPVKLSKKEKKKQKESKKLAKQKKIDADKDADESELNLPEKSKEKKKKKKFLFLHN